mgnify:FL=1
MDYFAVIDTETNWNNEVMSIGAVIAEKDTFKKVDDLYFIFDPEYKIGGMFSMVLPVKGGEHKDILFTRKIAMEKFKEAFEKYGISFEHMPSGIDTMTIFVHQSEFEQHEQFVISNIHRAVQPDSIELESDLALIAVVGRGMKSTRGTAGRIFSALAHARINVKMIDQGSSELNIIIGVKNADFEAAVKAIYDIFITAEL